MDDEQRVVWMRFQALTIEGAARGRLNRHAVAFGSGTLRLVYLSGRRPRRTTASESR
ncbi:MAG TPA: hypothetical protein VJ625_09850 [Propionibacteriaceae bacterium]|nr:hypothetical protein [Propionibacteriaceae bacterium]